MQGSMGVKRCAHSFFFSNVTDNNPRHNKEEGHTLLLPSSPFGTNSRAYPSPLCFDTNKKASLLE